MGRLSLWFLLGLTILAVSLHDLQVSAEAGPSESECRPYIEKALHELKTTDTDGADASTEASEGNTSEERNTSDGNNSIETEEENEAKQGTDSEVDDSTDDDTDRKEDSEEDTNSKKEGTTGNDADSTEDNNDSKEEEASKSNSNEDAEEENNRENLEKKGDVEITSDEQQNSQESDGTVRSSIDDEDHENESNKSVENDDNSQIDDSNEKQVDESSDNDDDENKTEEGDENSRETENETEEIDADGTIETNDNKVQSDEDDNQSEETKKDDEQSEEDDVNINSNKDEIGDGKSAENDEVETEENSKEKSEEKSKENDVGSIEETASREENYIQNAEKNSENSKEDQDMNDTEEDQSTEEATDKIKEDDDNDVNNTNEIIDESKEKSAEVKEDDDDNESDDDTADSSEDNDDNNESEETQPEDDLLLEVDIPENLRDRKHISELLHLDDEFEEKETAISNVADTILRDLKRIYENAIKPLEALYKYRDLSNRHFGDPEIFSKPLVLFMGPWSGGKSTIINYLTGNEYTDNSLRSGAEPSPAYFNILMHGDEPEVLDGTQLAADWTFSGLQKFGQGLEDRLRGLRLPHKLLEKVNIVEIPGILEVRKQVSRLFPFNDACQWFIDRADIIFLVYDPAKLDVGPETEAILDQLKGREYQTRIVLNKADLVKPEELLRVQSALIWNISPLMSSAQPPVMYTTSLWSHPYESSSPVRLLQAQERAFLRDLRTAIDKRIENKIASARRFAVRVRNHAKMVDCYLTTYYNHKSLFGNKKRISDQIIESPQNYHIYEGLSTLTNISRYDLPDPEVYRDFFRLNPLYEFKKLSETCTYFRGCPINKLDVAIAYDLPELVGKYKKMAESAVAKLDSTDTEKDKS